MKMQQEKRFELTGEKKVNVFGVELFRIKCTKTFDNKQAGKIEAGTLGGWADKKIDVRVYGNAWVSGNAEVYGDARVYGKLKLNIGLFFGFLFKGEKLKDIKLEDGNTLLSKEG